jgi:acyl-homoserine lactone acylase PvdQ
MKRAIGVLATLAIGLAFTIQASAAAPSPLGARTDHGLFLNILPAGQGHSVTIPEGIGYELAGQSPPNWLDQLDMYRTLPVDAGKVTDRNLSNYFKPETYKLGVKDIVSTAHPAPGVSIVRDRYGVPHIYGQTRKEAMWAAGYVTAEDRLFVADVLRHVGRGRLSEFLGASPANIDRDRGTYLSAGYSERELEMQVERYSLFGALGRQAYEDGVQYVAGLNARVAEVLADPSKLPAEYPALQLTPTYWKLTDLAAGALVIEAEFAGGGGGELSNAILLGRLQERYGRTRGRALFDDLMEREDPEAPTTITTPFPYETSRHVNPQAVAVPDPDSVRFLDPLILTPGEGTPPATSSSAAVSASRAAVGESTVAAVERAAAQMRLGFPDGMSNWLGVTADRTASGHPIAVMGPQVSYFSPQILMEIDIHAPGVSARGATFPGLGVYVLLGRGPNYAWSATSGESDLVDVRAERLCEPDGSPSSTDSQHYLYRGQCLPIYRRTDTWLAKPSAGGVGPPTLVSAQVERTIHGPVFARGVVNGIPVAFASQRTTFFKELDTAGTFALANNGRMNTPAAFRHAFSLMTGSFNWLYVNDRHVAYFHSGNYPIRAPGVDPDLPVWGTGQWEWRGLVPASKHPQAVDPAKGWMTSWNNKPAPAWRAADNQHVYGAVDRVQMLSSRLEPMVRRGGVRPSDVVRAMADAATVDLRGQEVLPDVLAAIGNDPKLARYVHILHSWVAGGAHRVDRDGNGQYDDQAAVALMDAWWEPMIHAIFDRQLGGLYDTIPIAFDDTNRAEGLGSSFQNGYYGFVDKAVRMALGRHVAGRFRVLRCADGTLAGCQKALRTSLASVVAKLGADSSKWNADEIVDDILYTAVGLVGVEPQPWQNRPTFQQVVMATSH